MKQKRLAPRLQIDCGAGGRTKQSFKDECDINSIMAKFEKTAMVEHVNEHQGRYADFTDGAQDFHSAMNHVRNTTEMFMTLPASMREQFNNDPGDFIEFISEAEEDELREHGLLPAEGDLAAAAAPVAEPEVSAPDDAPKAVETPE